MTYTPDTPRYFGFGVPPEGIPVGGSTKLGIRAVSGGTEASPSQTGLLLLYRDARPGREAEVVQIR
jgi:hypothetical protein